MDTKIETTIGIKYLDGSAAIIKIAVDVNAQGIPAWSDFISFNGKIFKFDFNRVRKRMVYEEVEPDTPEERTVEEQLKDAKAIIVRQLQITDIFREKEREYIKIIEDLRKKLDDVK